MKMHYFNLIGVLLLAGLCVAQWVRDRDLNLEVNRLQRAVQEQVSKLTEQSKIMRGFKEDLGDFKGRATETGAELRESRQKLIKNEREILQLGIERDQLKASVTNWAAAVAVRDQRLKESAAQIQNLAEELRTSVAKFNGLASNHNTLVKEINDLRARAAKLQQ